MPVFSAHLLYRSVSESSHPSLQGLPSFYLWPILIVFAFHRTVLLLAFSNHRFISTVIFIGWLNSLNWFPFQPVVLDFTTSNQWSWLQAELGKNLDHYFVFFARKVMSWLASSLQNIYSVLFGANYSPAKVITFTVSTFMLLWEIVPSPF
jgi:hypothetical protein